MKVQCPQCQTPINVDAVYAGRSIKCPKCSQSFIASHKNICEENNSSGFWSFRTMVTTKLVIVIFPIWCILTALIALIWIVLIVGSDYSDSSPFLKFEYFPKLLNIAIVVFAWVLNVCAFRVLCEGWIVIFRIHDTLEEIRNKS
jgi:predicted Zn finger-like uncharacterized protein